MAEVPASVLALAADRRSGAAEIARGAAEALAGLDPVVLPPALETLLRAHPSMAPLWRLAGRVLGAPSPAAGAAGFLGELERDGAAAEVAASLLPGSVLTISWSSGVLRALRLRRPDRVRCMASLPGGEGGRLAGALPDLPDVRVVRDEEALADPDAEAVLLGADAVGPGGVVNKVKSGALCAAARARGVPAICVAGGTKLLAEDLPATGAFERVALPLLDLVALPDGPAGPEAVADWVLGWPVHPSLLPLLEELRRGTP